MLVTLLLMVSAALIGAGAALLLRDWLQKARAPFVGDAPLSRTIRLAPEEAQITIARTNAAPREETHAVEVDVPRPVSPAKPVLRVAAPPAQPEEIERTERMLVRHDEISQATAPEPDPGPKSGPDTGSDPASDPGSDPGPVPEPEPRTVPVTTPLVSDRADLWQHLLLALDGAVARANTRLAGREISVGLRRVPMAESGAPAEQGATFPILVAGRREAWLRLERDSEGHIVARVTALASRGLAEPQPEQRQLPEGASDPDLDAMLDACLLPLAPRALPMVRL